MSEAKAAIDPTTNSIPVALDCSKAAIGVWLVKVKKKFYFIEYFKSLINLVLIQVPKYLAKKWNTAPDNAEVGRIRITQSRFY